MAKIYNYQDFQYWLDRDLLHRKPDCIQWIPGPIKVGEDAVYMFSLYTDTNRYTITARIPFNEESEGYLGCTSMSRKARPGEDWFRGSDLADGPFKPGTWSRILASIVAYELQSVKL